MATMSTSQFSGVLPQYGDEPHLTGFEIRNSAEVSTVVVHVPHTGLVWPNDGTAVPDYPRLDAEIEVMADLGVDLIADLVDAWYNSNPHSAELSVPYDRLDVGNTKSDRRQHNG
ncbi:MAG: hypothetical protein FWG47_01440 [Propionibacteriaceae bacterium]|nr:hypothetical protein [Propionibacteriaceae bacterium]